MTIKKQKLRNNEYYDIQEMFDDLYDKAKNRNNYKFYKLMDLINSEQNILLAYRNIKKNTGSKTVGTNNKNIEYLGKLTNNELIELIRNRLKNYQPHKVRRVEIPKPNGKTRPLGIPTIEDRLIQQCIKQILEPICEAKFHNHSYGFRPNRSTHHAIGRCYHLIQRSHLHYVVDIDIKSFFDKVNHSKLIKQLWSLGIQDKQLLCIISKMLKAPIQGEGIPTMGTPQGGILSPLLSNIVLNELDWWLSDQWETFKTRKDVTTYRKDGSPNYSNKYTLMRKTKLKELFIVRYADDLKIFCKDHRTATKIYHSTKQWLEERLKLEVNEEKSKIVNLKTNYSEFLGFKITTQQKGDKRRVKSHICDKANKKIKDNMRKQIKLIKHDTNEKNVNQYNAMVLGFHNYYKVATHVNLDFNKIAFDVSKNLYNRTRTISTTKGKKSITYDKFYGKYNCKINYICGIALFPIHAIATKAPMNFSQDISNYTEIGRMKIHNRQRTVSTSMLRHIMENPIPGMSAEYNDNRLSLYVGQNGMCIISETILNIEELNCHHKTPKSVGGTDEYSNLMLMNRDVHKLIHATKKETISKYLQILNFNDKGIGKINKYRKLIGNTII